MKVLFILKRKIDYVTDLPVTDSIGLTTGLYNSAKFVNDVLIKNGIDSKMSVVIDANSIDKEVYNNRPTHVIIEALWVTPAKFSELSRLHPTVKWIVRLHSELPFLANEGMAMDWIGDYGANPNIVIGVNSTRMIAEIRRYYHYVYSFDCDALSRKIIFLPNCYPDNFFYKKYRPGNVIDIGCFGAIRPMKNHLIQATAAIRFAEYIGKKLRFHINAGRVEQKGSSVLHNLEGLFSHLHARGHKLINHPWVEHDMFLKICSDMDIGMQVSLNETFNIVAADFISQSVPVVCSKEIPWASNFFIADPTNARQIFDKLLLSHRLPSLNILHNRCRLRNNILDAENTWLYYFGSKYGI